MNAGVTAHTGLVSKHDLVVLGASAGGVETLRDLFAALPAELDAAVLVVLHLSPGSSSLLPHILDRAGPLPAVAARDGDPVVPGRALVAPPDRHLLVVGGRVVLSSGPRENGHRPAIDVTMRSAALAYGPRMIGAVLTGMLDDGAAGLRAVQREGGMTIVQDPEDALFPSMPRHALAATTVDHVLSAAEIAKELPRLVASSPAERRVAPRPAGGLTDAELDAAEIASALVEEVGLDPGSHPGELSPYVCPDCSGVLYEITDGPLLRFRCRVGHAWSASSLAAVQGTAVEDALWVALRTLEERALLTRRMSETAHKGGRDWSAEHFRKESEQAQTAARTLRDLLRRGIGKSVDDGTEPVPLEPPAG